MFDAAAIAVTVKRAAEGDQVAFARLVAEHHAAMTRVAYVIVGDATVASDAVQAAWAIAWQRIGGLRDPDQVRAWLIAIAANEARGSLRRGRRQPVVVDISGRACHRRPRGARALRGAPDQVSVRSSISQAWSSACHAIRRAA